MQTRHWRTEFRVGDRRVLGIADGVFTMTDDFMSVPGYQHRFDDATGRANLPVGCFLVEGDRTVLIDAGLGPFATENLVGGDLLDELAAIGVQPADVDIVAVSHLHLDHDGWIATRDAGLTFPNATMHVGRRDYEHFVVSDPDGLASELGVPARGRRAVPPRWLPVTGARPVVTTGATATGECDHRGTKRAPTEVDVTQASGPSGSGWTALSAERDVMGSQQGNDTSAASSVSVAPNPLSDTFTSLMADGPIEVREGYADVGDQTLHYVEAGDGPLLVLLHGFPEFWFGWRLQIQPLAAAGFRVVAPDTRGYNLSSKPEGFEAYGVDLLADDIRGFIGALGAESAHLVGHDWGGSIAWTVAMNHPEVVDRLAILNAAHPRRLSEGLHHPSQLRKSWYFFFFATPGLPEDVVHARDWHFFRHFLQDANPPYTQQEIERYIEAWSQPGAAAGMINYYRASVRQSQKEAAAKLRPLSASTLVIWGENDSYLGSELAEPDREDVPNLDRVERLPDASHWVHHDQADRVNQLLIDFFH